MACSSWRATKIWPELRRLQVKFVYLPKPEKAKQCDANSAPSIHPLNDTEAEQQSRQVFFQALYASIDQNSHVFS
ncbi:hypothetical protein RRG08_032999 [Elysia crispata]|uniref:Uncharacterized protein n=1 Tax=Elysia crispata TaxID=231223 RepID=A0AAE0YRZ6_9GAST|nr:hypothetical protein RRG08_032999 [Elysia crispata]